MALPGERDVRCKGRTVRDDPEGFGRTAVPGRAVLGALKAASGRVTLGSLRHRERREAQQKDQQIQ